MRMDQSFMPTEQRLGTYIPAERIAPGIGGLPAMGPEPLVVILVLNWNAAEDTLACLDSLGSLSYPRFHVIVVDNGSDDNSVAAIRKYALESNSRLFRSPEPRPPRTTPQHLENVPPPSPERTAGGVRRVPAFSRGLVTILENASNLGFAAGNNVAIRFAISALSPDYIILLNNDVVVDPNFVSELVKTAES